MRIKSSLHVKWSIFHQYNKHVINSLVHSSTWYLQQPCLYCHHWCFNDKLNFPLFLCSFLYIPNAHMHTCVHTHIHTHKSEYVFPKDQGSFTNFPLFFLDVVGQLFFPKSCPQLMVYTLSLCCAEHKLKEWGLVLGELLHLPEKGKAY